MRRPSGRIMPFGPAPRRGTRGCGDKMRAAPKGFEEGHAKEVVKKGGSEGRNVTKDNLSHCHDVLLTSA